MKKKEKKKKKKKRCHVYSNRIYIVWIIFKLKTLEVPMQNSVDPGKVTHSEPSHEGPHRWSLCY